MDQTRTPLFSGIEELIKTEPAYFRIPGHRLDRGISSKWTDRVGTEIFKYDVTETPFTDDLHAPETVILEAEQLLADLYEAKKSFFLVNGTTCGNEAMIMASAFENQKVLVARNAHKSANMGLVLSGAKPVYVMPETLSEWGIQGGISANDVEKAFIENPDAKAFFIVSPSYYGVTSDLEGIARVCHKYGALLLVDEAHGGHVYFHDALPKGAIKAGADMCVQSMHKITGALTQSSVLHVNKHADSVDIDRLSNTLHLVQSTSPSYLLMTSLDLARYELAKQGEEMMKEAIALADYARSEINKIHGFKCMGKEICGKANIDELDITRLVISAKEIGIGGFELDEMLMDLNVNMELSDALNVLAVVTYANTKEDMDRLICACRKISDENKHHEPLMMDYETRLPKIPLQIKTPRQAYFSNKKEIPFEESLNQISAEMIAPYPPGIPVIYPGEQITKEVMEYLTPYKRDGRHIHGSKDGKLEYVQILA